MSLKKYIQFLSNKLIESCSTAKPTPPYSYFHITKVPKISLLDFMLRINKYLFKPYSQSDKMVLWTHVIILLDKYITHSNRHLSSYTIHRLLAISCLLTVKQLMDDHEDNELAARVFGLTLGECNFLEMNFFFDIKFESHIPLEVYADYQNKLEIGLQVMDTSLLRFKLPNIKELPIEQDSIHDLCNGIEKARISKVKL